MKILYALQCTGNGHITRAQELVPEFNQQEIQNWIDSGHYVKVDYPDESAAIIQRILEEFANFYSF